MIIPNLLEPHKDELIYSYFIRLGAENGFDSIKRLINRIINKNKDHYWNYDGKGLFPKLLTVHDIHSHRLIKNCSMYPYQAIFLTPYRQAITVDMLFNNSPAKKFTGLRNLIVELHYCKECMAEDIHNYGYYYIHRSHQLPGVTVCYKHHTPLFSDRNISVETTEDAVDFAEFSHALLQANLQTDISQIETVLLKHLKDKNLIKININSCQISKIPDIVRILMHTFNSVDNLTSCLPKNTDTILKFIAAAGSEYDVFEPYNSTIIKLRHKSCNRIFFTTPAGFIAGQKCSCLNETTVPTSMPFKEAIKALVGDEYTVLDDCTTQKTSVAMKHNTCGSVHIIKPWSFLAGYRCPQCSTIVANNTFISMVEYMTNGQYKVTRYLGDNLFEITESGGQIIELTKNMFLQEVRRPTPSTILPVPVKKLRDDWDIWNKNEKPTHISIKDLLDKIHSLYTDNQLIFRDDLKEMFSKNYFFMLNNALFKLIRDKKLYRIEPGIYCLKNRKLSPKRLFMEKYLIRNGHRIGIFEKDSLAYELGILNEKPNMMYIKTNAKSYKSHHRMTVNGFSVSLQGNTITITDDNYKYIMVLEALKLSRRYPQEKKKKRILAFINKNNLSLDKFSQLLPSYNQNIQNKLSKI